MNQPRALVIGGSLSGLFTANLLRTIGWHVEVFERAHSDLTGRGAGLGAQADLFAAMRRIGIQIDRSLGSERPQRRRHHREVPAVLPRYRRGPWPCDGQTHVRDRA